MRHYVMQLIPWLLRLSHHELLVFYRIQGLPSLASVLRRLSASDRSRVEVVQIDDQEQIFGYAHRFDLYFCPLNGFAPRLLDRPTVGTLADIQDQYFPEYFTPPQLELRRVLYPFMARAVTTLLTISEFSKRSICEKYGISPAKVTVTHIAPSDDIMLSRPSWPTMLPPLPKRYVFFPANLYPHKNHELLLQAIGHVRKRLGIDCACVMTGHEANPGIAIRDRIETNGLVGVVHWLGHVPPSALRYLYENAAALAFPSQFEGFGMPLVEAMRCGCPVIATPAASIPEIVGDAGVLVEATPEAFAAAIARVLENGEERNSLIARGRARASRFTPQAMTEATLAVLEEAPARFAGTHRGATRGVSYVVRPKGGAESLIKSLSSIAYEAEGDDQVLILADASALSSRALALADNMPNTELIGSIDDSAWVDRVKHEFVRYVDEGQEVVPGSTGAALATLVENRGCQAVVGEALGIDSRGQYTGSAGCDHPVQHAATAIWRRAGLMELRSVLDQRSWATRIADLLGGRLMVIERTFARVWSGPGTPGGIASAPAPMAAQPSRTRLKTALWSRCARQIAKGKGAVRRLSSYMPKSIETGLRNFYLRQVRPYVYER
jgi:glycosyltransferase involved in cell wall biosynthesis